MKVVTTPDPAIAAQAIIEHLDPREHATVVTLYGDLGAGKTTVVQEIGKLLGITTAIQSPTFILQNVYTLSGLAFDRLVHIDAYRLTSGDELKHIGWDTIARDPKNIIIVEWPEHVADVLPNDSVRVEIDDQNDQQRTYRIHE